MNHNLAQFAAFVGIAVDAARGPYALNLIGMVEIVKKIVCFFLGLAV